MMKIVRKGLKTKFYFDKYERRDMTYAWILCTGIYLGFSTAPAIALAYITIAGLLYVSQH